MLFFPISIMLWGPGKQRRVNLKNIFFFATQKNTEDVAISATHQQPIQLFTSKKKKIKSPYFYSRCLRLWVEKDKADPRSVHHGKHRACLLPGLKCNM